MQEVSKYFFSGPDCFAQVKEYLRGLTSAGSSLMPCKGNLNFAEACKLVKQCPSLFSDDQLSSWVKEDLNKS